jgi:hypothetical protein
VTQFVLGPRYYQVYVQLDGKYRNKPEDLKQIYVRSTNNTMISLDQLVTIKPYTDPRSFPISMVTVPSCFRAFNPMAIAAGRRSTPLTVRTKKLPYLASNSIGQI